MRSKITKTLPFLLVGVCLLFCRYGLQAQCDPGQSVPIYPIDLCGSPDNFVLDTLLLDDECCVNQPGGNSCFIVRLPLCSNFGSFTFCFDPPCSLEGYTDFMCDAGGMLVASDTFDLCREQVCLDQLAGVDSVDILVCKPGAADQMIELAIQGVDSVKLEVDTLVEPCMSSLVTRGAVEVVCNGGSSPPSVNNLPITITSVADPNLDYLSCDTCRIADFNYTGPPITDCNGIFIDYTVSIPATSCAPAQSVTDSFLVYPDIDGTLEKNCIGSAVEFAFVPDPNCAGYSYEWTMNGSVIPGETDSTLTVDPADNQTYCVRIFRDVTTECDTVELCGIAGSLTVSCPIMDGGSFGCLEDVPAADTTLVMILDSCYNPRFEIEEDTSGLGCIGDTMILTRRYIVIDDDGDPMTLDPRDTCTRVFTIVDDTAPTISCPPDTLVDCTSPTDTMTLGVVTATDDCDSQVLDITFSDNIITGSCADNYTIERTWTATDSCGNSSTCLQTIMVQDTTDPDITCPADTTVNCTEDTSPGNLGMATATDNCTDDVTD
ncbi:MAG: hypothetical protein R3275_13190, partial [Saprospiraceae bacterium]|nr:hypothetical protein [Saprospiraceae bacterium]